MSVPAFDFGAVTRRWSKALRANMAEMMELATLIEAPARDDLEAGEIQALQRGRLDAMRRLPALETERDALVAQVLVAIPRDWLAPDAPEEIDWSDPDSLDWLLERRYDDLLRAMGEARNDSKNSVARS
jgi:hypothetical protein